VHEKGRGAIAGTTLLLRDGNVSRLL
jgi:hypothetical protein